MIGVSIYSKRYPRHQIMKDTSHRYEDPQCSCEDARFSIGFASMIVFAQKAW